MHPREQLAIGVHHAFLAADLASLAQQHEQVLAEQGVAMVAALAALNPEQHAPAVDVADFQLGDLRSEKLGPIGYRLDRL